jgi:hypothetical protein
MRFILVTDEAVLSGRKAPISDSLPAAPFESKNK